jgi:hypothetical protein
VTPLSSSARSRLILSSVVSVAICRRLQEPDRKSNRVNWFRLFHWRHIPTSDRRDAVRSLD